MAKLAYTGFENCSFFPFPPKGGVKETREFQTQVIIAEDGTETRDMQRAIARQIFNFRISAQMKNRTSISNMIDQNLRGDWALPIWTEAQYAGTISGTSISVDTTISDFRVDGLVLIFSSMNNYEIRQIIGKTDTTITINSSVSLLNAYVIPVNKAFIKGDISSEVHDRDTMFDMTFEMKAPAIVGASPTGEKPYLCLCITPHCSATSSSTLQNPNLNAIVELLRGLVVNSGYKIDVRWYFWNDINRPRYDYYDAQDADFDDMLAKISAVTYQAGTIPNSAASWALDWFQTVNPNPDDGTRKDIWLFTMNQGASNLDAAAATAADMVGRTAPFDGYSEVDIVGLLINQTTLIQIIKLDNVDHDNISNTTSADPFNMRNHVSDLLRDRYKTGTRYLNYEIFDYRPENEQKSFSKTYTRREDRLDFGGAVEVLSPWLYGQIMTDHPIALNGLEEIRDFRAMLTRFGGKARTFWVPTYTSDLQPISLDNTATIMVVNNTDIDEYNENRRYVAFENRNGDIFGAEIFAVDDLLDGTYQLTFTEALRETNVSNIIRGHWLGLGRLGSDQIDMNWVASKYVELVLPTVEVSK